MGTLVPVNMQTATTDALAALAGRPVDVVAIIRETQAREFYYDLRKDNRPGARWAVGRSTAEGLTKVRYLPRHWKATPSRV